MREKNKMKQKIDLRLLKVEVQKLLSIYSRHTNCTHVLI